MGRRKLEIKRIEDKSARQVTFSKRRNGLLKKAKELSVLCDVEIAALIFSNRGKLYHFCSSSNNLPGILKRYNSSVEEEAGPSSTGTSETQQEQHSKYEGYLPYQELLQIVERELEDPGNDELSVNELQHLENQLEATLIRARSTKTHLLMDSISGLQEKGKTLAEENRLLEEKVAGKKKSSSSPGGGQKKIILDLNVLANSSQ